MDGNGRWAKSRGLPRIAGHREGVKTVRRLIEAGPELGVEVMTFFTFSAENWRRPIFEVSALMDLLLESVNREVDDLHRNGVRLAVIGDIDQIPTAPRAALEAAIAKTSGNKRMTLVLALSYSARWEIVRAVNRILKAGLKSVDEQTFGSFLDTADLPDPDLLVRTSGEYRLSNFLLYQLAYTEIVVSQRYWPDFSVSDLLECIVEYQRRERRFGQISEQVGA